MKPMIDITGAACPRTVNVLVGFRPGQDGKETMKYTKDFEKWLSCVEWPQAMLRDRWHADEIKRFAWSAWQASRRRIRKHNEIKSAAR